MDAAAEFAPISLVFFLFGIFCAYWAQETGRNPWQWFFLGWFFAPFTGLVLLRKNSEDRESAKPHGPH